MLRNIILLVSFLLSISSKSQIKTHLEFQLGKQQYNQKNYARAIKFFNYSIERSEDQYQVLFFRGLSKFALNDFIGAETDLLKAIYYKPFYPSAYHNLALVQLNSNKFWKGIANLTTSIKQDSLNAEAYFHRAISYSKINQFNSCLEDINHCLSLNKLQLKALKLRAEIYVIQENYDLALEDINNVINKNSPDEEDYVLRAKIYSNKKAFSESNTDANYILQYLNPESLEAKYWKAYNFNEMEDSKKSIALVNEILEKEPFNIKTLFLNALIHWKLEKYKIAATELEKLHEAIPGNINILNNLAKLYFQQKKYSKTLSLLKKSNSIFPEFPETYELLTNTYLNLNNKSLAKKANDNFIKYSELSETYSEVTQITWQQKYFALKALESSEIEENNLLKEALQLTELVQVVVNKIENTNDSKKLFLSKNLHYPSLDLLPFKLEIVPTYQVNNTLLIQTTYQTIDSLIKTNPSPDTKYLRAQFTFQNGKIFDAEKEATQLLATYPNHGLTHGLLAQICWIKWEQEFNNLKSGNLLIQDEITESLQSKKLKKQTIDHFEKALTYTENADFILYNYAIFKAQQGQLRKAIELLEEAYLKNPKEKEIAYNLALINYKTDRFEEACKYLSIAGSLGKKEAYDLISIICR